MYKYSILLQGVIYYTKQASTCMFQLRVSVSIYYWYVCREGNITCGAYGVGQSDVYRYIKDTNGKVHKQVLARN